ncbi:hypothetical protein DUNSADRAFT_104 [Dunaliella salina]|uniref:Uncharacterized protein n=1 Tax=Dunaliella salina TaxID=3046 RepID=A0ABQ7H8W8_DUNSA|nr:hypothetical protein DUNSADRAFT_104 [Dunaliella salina]|eukprot:KAF5843302.1 hypothetical protein DUNSADRAFT_104 [Dunaliella salina]
MGGSLLGLLLTLVFASILQAFIHVSWLQWIISVGGATLFSGVSAAFIYSAPVRGFVASNPWTLWTALGGSLVLVLLLSFSQTARRKHPWNMLSLFAFTACEALLVGTVCATYQANVVLLAVGATAATVSGLALFALNTK